LLIFDAHLDLAWNALAYDRDLTLPIGDVRGRESAMTDERCRGRATVSLPEMRRGGVGLCVATLLGRSGPNLQLKAEGYRRTDLDHATPEIAHAIVHGQLAWYRLMDRRGHLRLIDRADALRRHVQAWRSAPHAEPVGVILSMEGADPIDEPAELQDWFNAGLRAVGLAHYGMSRYAGGTDQDAGLSPLGVELLKRMQELGMVLDITHLCDRSVDEALDLFGGRVLASHHNCRSLVPGIRQLSDEHVKRLVERDGIVGASMDAWMLHPGWETGTTPRESVSLEAAAIQIDHVCQLAGDAQHAAIGSDLDGGFGSERTPHDLETVADLHRLGEHLSARGYNDADIRKIFSANWIRFYGEALPD